ANKMRATILSAIFPRKITVGSSMIPEIGSNTTSQSSGFPRQGTVVGDCIIKSNRTKSQKQIVIWIEYADFDFSLAVVLSVFIDHKSLKLRNRIFAMSLHFANNKVQASSAENRCP
ncbi:MAG: hypothetical protein ACREC8_05840, partial [Limisphaerales bacterium]